MGGMRSMRRLRGLGGRAAPAIVGQGENFEFWILNWENGCDKWDKWDRWDEWDRWDRERIVNYDVGTSCKLAPAG